MESGAPEDVRQFGEEPAEYAVRHCAYVVVINPVNHLLALKVNGAYHLPGGGMDEGESPEISVLRETKEETGCELGELRYLGKANQYFSASKLGPLNKLGTFFCAVTSDTTLLGGIEVDHLPVWITPEEFITGPSAEFQKWAVKEASR